MRDPFQEKIVDFVLARRHEKGGFGAAPTLPPSVEDTYLSLRILQQLPLQEKPEAAAVIGDPSLAQFLQDPHDSEQWLARTGFHYAYCCRIAHVKPDAAWAKQFVSNRLQDVRGLAGAFYCSRMITTLSAWFPELPPFSLKSGTIPWRTARDVRMALFLADGQPRKLHADRKHLVVWLRSCQNPDGGFGFTPSTTSYLENVHACLQALAMLKETSRNPSGAASFIRNSWSKDGGFARKKGGAPFLESTWHAVASLSLLNLLHQSR